MNLDDEFFEYLKRKGFNERWFFMASVQNLLLYVANGFSNRKVAKMVGLEEKYIQGACREFLDFDGWKDDLDYSPLYRSRNDLLTNEEERAIMDRYIEYRKELDDYYERDEVT
jgi:transposase